MISYGHGVAKAGAAGSAVGAGAVGLFRGMGRPLDQAQKAGSRGSRRAPAGQQREGVVWDIAQPANSTSLRLVGGVQAAGVEPGAPTPRLVRRHENVHVLGAEWGGGPDDASDAAEAVVAEAVPEAAADSGAPSGVPAGQARVVIAAKPSAAKSPQSTAVSAAPVAAKAALPVESGMSLEQVRKVLGTPKFSFVNVAGWGYSDQYVFELEDGRRIVVFARDGLVSRVQLAG